MPDYLEGKIYTIKSLTNDNVYVGSTILPLKVRMAVHRYDYKKNKGLGLYKNIVEDIDDWFIELYENFPCDKREKLNKREGEVIKNIGTLNKNIAGRTRTMKEWINDNPNYLKQHNKQYYIKNADKIKQYYIKNVDKIKEYQKQYRIKMKLLKKQDSIITI